MGPRRSRINTERRRPPIPIEDASRGLVPHRFEVAPRDVVYVKSLVEASEGIASIFAETGGLLTIAAPPERDGELRRLLGDVARELAEAGEGRVRWECPPSSAGEASL